MDKFEDIFAEFRIESPDFTPDENYSIPEFDYWAHKYSRKPLTKAQDAFFTFFLKEFKAGRPVHNRRYRDAYVALLKDRLLDAIKDKGRNNIEVLTDVQRLVSFYGYQGEDLAKYLGSYSKLNRLSRRKKYLKLNPAKWIPFDMELEINGYKTVRGGFYLGTHLYVPQLEKHTSRNKGINCVVEAGVINPLISPDDELAGIGIKEPESFLELNKDTRIEIYKFLCDKIYAPNSCDRDSVAMPYYFFGLQYRLFLDPDTDNDERRRIISELINQLNNERKAVSYYFYKDFASQLSHLYQHAMITFFSADEIVDMLLPEQLARSPIVLEYLISTKITEESPMMSNPDYLFDIISPLFDMSKYGLPKSMIDGFKSQWRSNIPYYFPSKFKFAPVLNKKFQRRFFNPLGRGPGIVLNSDVANLVEKSSKVTNLTNQFDKVYEYMSESFLRTFREIKYFAEAYSERKLRISDFLTLPLWVDLNDFPELKDFLSKILPPKGQKFREFSRADLESVFCDNRPPVSADCPIFYEIEYTLSKLNCDMAPQSRDKYKFSDDDWFYIFRNDSSKTQATLTTLREVPLFLIAWMIQKDKSESDFDKIDRWIEAAMQKNKSPLLLQSYVRFFAAKKRSLTQKFKAKASTTFIKYPNKEKEFLEILWELTLDSELMTIPARVKKLEKIYEIINRDPSKVHSDIHQFMMHGGAKSRTISGKGTGRSANVVLDKKKLAAMKADTLKSQEMLADVFQDDTKPQNRAQKTSVAKREPFMDILEALAGKDHWEMSEVEDICKKHKQIANSILEKIADYAYEKIDESPLDIDGDEIYVDVEIAKSLLNNS